MTYNSLPASETPNLALSTSHVWCILANMNAHERVDNIITKNITFEEGVNSDVVHE